MNPVTEKVLTYFTDAKPHAGQWKARCPAHDDQRASLSIGPADNGGCVLRCFAGCVNADIVAAVGLTLADLMPPKAAPLSTEKPEWVEVPGSKKFEAAYSYVDAEGVLLYQAVRSALVMKNTRTGDTKPDKAFYQRRPDGAGGWINKNVFANLQRVLYRLPDVLRAVADGLPVYIVEGEKDADNLTRAGFVATSNVGGATSKWLDNYSETLRGASVVVIPDNDAPGRKHAADVAASLHGVAASVKVLELPDLPPKGDVSDWLKAGGSADALNALAAAAPEWVRPASSASGAAPVPFSDRNPITAPEFAAKPRPLTADLAPVSPWEMDLLPSRLAPYVQDVSERIGCPPEYVAAPLLVGLASVLGKTVAMRPKEHDTGWVVYANLWGANVGGAGMQKTPAVSEALKPIKRLQAETLKQHECDLENYQIMQAVAKAKADGAKDQLKAAAKAKKSDQELRLLAIEAKGGEDEPPPTWRRFVINDSTVEKTGELLNENENGLLQERDELTGFLKTLNKQGHENDRAFYLEAWNGSGSYIFDRIGRGTIPIKNLCLSLFGTIQPGPLAKYLRGNGEEADGFVPRFQILVYPDPPPEFVNVDRPVYVFARERAFEVFNRFANLEPSMLGAHFDNDGNAYLHFLPDAQELFNEWRTTLENRLHHGHDMPLMQTHLSKYRSLIPSLALIFHLAEGGSGDVSIEALALAIRWGEFLETHARRIYLSAMDGDTEAAQHLADRIRKSIPNPFSPRDVQRKGLRGLDTADAMEKALGILEDRGWVKAVETQPGPGGGRPSTLVYINPAVMELSE